jgi:FlaA1/EpsC-like NDP-sugar epimerase
MDPVYPIPRRVIAAQFDRFAASLRNRHLLALDAALAASMPAVAFWLRFEGFGFEESTWHMLRVYTGAALVIKIFVFFASGLYRRLWRYASLAELERIFIAGALAGLGCVVLGAVLLPGLGVTETRVPLSVLAFDFLATIGIAAAPRLLMRFAGAARRQSGGARRPAVVAGAGLTGQAILRESIASPRAGIEVVAFVDDDRSKHGMLLGGVKVAGALEDVGSVVRSFNAQEVIIAIPHAAGPLVRSIVEDAKDAGASTRIVPAIRELLSGELSVSKLRQVEIEDLLRREPIRTDLARVRTLAEGRTVLVTGGGGSIGSELCRQIAELGPSRLVVLDHAENPVFSIVNELQRKLPGVPVAPVIADIRNAVRVRQVFERFMPVAVFHAAAHKHVPLMEENVYEAVTNNILGTRNVVDAALDADTEHFVLISTDKAVRPTSVMGATKRLAEHVVHHAAITEKRNFVSVRFGNVLGSSGSVIPIFLDQIRNGGPVTVTHPDMRRYFMTIPEAVQLVLQAGAMGKGGELFVLDMGEPVRVADLARDLIRLSGLSEADIDIVFTGARPGEKLFEEIFLKGEDVTGTEHPKILRVRHEAAAEGVNERLEALVSSVLGTADDQTLRELLHGLVPDYSRVDARRETESALADHV